MPYVVSLAEEVRDAVGHLAIDLRKSWDRLIDEIIADPLPRDGDGFSIIVARNQFGDVYLSLAADELPFRIQFDLYPWPTDRDNPRGDEGLVHVFRIGGLSP